MTKVSKSPQRGTFQIESVIRRAIEKGLDPNDDPNTVAMVDFYKSFALRDEANLSNTEWQKDNLEYDLRTTEWILEKVRNSEVYAQNLYASMCNTDFIKNDVWPLLTDEVWSCSWRHAGGIISDMRQEGDYIDWYCSGMSAIEGYVGEGVVTDEVRSDLLKLGWLVREIAD